jgi:ribosomal protein S18 acetylase RimI-like enzyme
MQIRKAKQNDAKVLAELGAKTFYDTFRPHNTEEDMQTYIKKSYSIEIISENLSNTNIQYFIAFDDEVPIGYIKLIKNKIFEKLDTKKNIELEKIYVLNSYHDKKIGKELMLAAIQFSMEENFETLFLGVWQENKRAINFYKKFEFETFATRAFKLGNEICDDFMMKLSL